MGLEFIKPEIISLKNNPEFNEKWVQEIIAKDPSILGLGDLILKDKERNQPRAGRLDLLLQDEDAQQRYEVEIQLGEVDESHIIRTIEYWDIERKRYPQYDHCAVIIAEDITNRFLNVISLFNGSIPLIAIQMKAVKIGNTISLIFTKVLDQAILGTDDDDAETEVTDRNYWEQRGSKETVAIADEILKIIRDNISDKFALKYNKAYIGLTENGRANNFVYFVPRKKNHIRFILRNAKTKEIDDRIEINAFDGFYDNRNGRYIINLTKNDMEAHKNFIIELLKTCYGNSK